jgi:RecA/RadA recombinase
MADVKVIKAECNPEFKSQLQAFLKKKGESEASIVRKALRYYMQVNSAPKQP